MAEVRLESVTKQYGKTVAVDRVDLEVRDREFLVLLGPSGCGKSTTLRMIAGLEEISAGTIRIGDRIVNDVAPKDRDVAMVFQNYALYPHMNVYQNMAFGLRMRRTPKAEIDRRIRSAAATLDIEGLLKRKPWQLSGGERQRVAVGRAIVRDPAVFLFDEPLSNLDAKLRVVMRSELVRLQEQLRTTTIYVTHDQVDAMMMGHRIAVMNQGRVQQIGPPLDVYARPANQFVAEFIGSPPMNLIPAEVVADGGRLWLDSAAGRLVVPNAIAGRLRDDGVRRVSWGIRPEDLRVLGSDVPPDTIATIAARARIVHQLGHETIVEAEAGEPPLPITLRLVGAPPERGSPMTLGVPADRLHIFDAVSGTALRAPESNHG